MRIRSTRPTHRRTRAGATERIGLSCRRAMGRRQTDLQGSADRVCITRIQSALGIPAAVARHPAVVARLARLLRPLSRRDLPTTP